jgi:Asp-tRNA(Asn)/Glu-tRNA(Gln) amidotransferase B subunit
LKYGISVSDVKIIFKYPWAISLFEKLAAQSDPKIVFKWLYDYINGNCQKKELDFQETVLTAFG